MSRRERLVTSRKKAKMSQAVLAEKMGVKQPYIAAIEKSGDFSYKQACIIAGILGVDENWLFFDIEASPKDIYVEATELTDNTLKEPGPKYRTITANAAFIGSVSDQTDADGNTKFTEISPGRYRMKVDLVPFYARAGYLAGFGDHPYIEELPKHEITVSKYHRGKYMAFEVAGDSMYDGTINSIPDKSIITGRVVERDLWQSKLHTHKHDYWIFIDKHEGMLIKRIKSQDTKTGDVVLESLNPDKYLYPDQTINLADVHQILNAVKIEREL